MNRLSDTTTCINGHVWARVYSRVNVRVVECVDNHINLHVWGRLREVQR